MADISARESKILINQAINLITDNFGTSIDKGDTEGNGTSILREGEAADSLDSDNRRLIREQAKHRIDRIIEDKLEDPNLAAIDSLDEALERISRERQLEREQYKTVAEKSKASKKKNKKKNRRSKQAAAEQTAAAVQLETVEPMEAVEIVEVVRITETEEPAAGAPDTTPEFFEILEAEEAVIHEPEEALQTPDAAAIQELSETKVVVIEQPVETGISEVLDLLETEESADNRLDLYMDQILTRFRNGLTGFQNHLTGLGIGLKQKLNHVFAPLAIKVFPPLAIRTITLRNRIAVKEDVLSAKMAAAVDRTDLALDRLSHKTTQLALSFIKKQREARSWCEGHKRQLLTGAAGVAVVAACSAVVVGNITAYEYMYNGKVMGVVKDQQDVYKTIDIIGDKLAYAYGAEITIDKEKDISFNKIMGFGIETDCREEVLNQFTYLRDMNATAYAIKVDGQQKTILYSKECAEDILNEIQNQYLTNSDSVEYETVGFAERVEISEVNTKIANIQDENDALDYMLTGAVEIKTYPVQAGDTFNQIARNLGMSADDLQSTNPEVNPARLQIGQELVLNRVRPVLTVETTEVAEYTLPIDFEIEYEETSALYKGEETVKSSGTKGQRQVVAQIVRHNGEEVSRNELSSKVLSEPKSQVVLKGTKDLPPLMGTGRFIYPTRGRLSSGFGPRWGRMHNGIDLAAPTGTKIRAADGGRVISAGWEGALGYCVRIDHGQNRVTVYGHASKLFVKAGDRVYQDQHIANVGSTGRSTGSHLHFEVHINGVPQNPLKYLK